MSFLWRFLFLRRHLPFPAEHPIMRTWFRNNLFEIILEFCLRGVLLGAMIILSYNIIISNSLSVQSKCVDMLLVLLIGGIIVLLFSLVSMTYWELKNSIQLLAQYLEIDQIALKSKSVDELTALAEATLISLTGEVLAIEKTYPTIAISLKSEEEQKEWQKAKSTFKRVYDFFTRETGIPIKEGYHTYFLAANANE